MYSLLRFHALAERMLDHSHFGHEVSGVAKPGLGLQRLHAIHDGQIVLSQDDIQVVENDHVVGG